jgi:prepilin-type N-terminal cleavage/methylation domain-containing protein
VSAVVKHLSGFTLAELLVALAILGIIVTFTIPKVLVTGQEQQKVAVAKEVAAMISGAFQQAKAAGIVSANTKPRDLTPYMNYVSVDTSGSLVDAIPGNASNTCNSTSLCLKLHNGGVLWFQNWQFGGTSSLYTIEMSYDPDGSQNTTSTADGPLKAVQFTLYYDGFLTTRGYTKPNSCNIWDCTGLQPNSTLDPSWFHW